MTNWKKHQNANQQLIEFAADLAVEHLGDRLVGVGNSPAWIIRTMQEFYPWSPLDHVSVPFSGRILKRDTNGKRPGIYAYVPEDEEALGDYRNYRQLLKQQGLSPIKIYTNYLETGRKTVFLDFFQNGEGIASFLYLMMQWAHNDKVLDGFMRAIEVHVYSSAERQEDIDRLEIRAGDIKVGNKPYVSYIPLSKVHVLELASDEILRCIPHMPPKKAPTKDEPVSEVPPTSENLYKEWVLRMQRRTGEGGAMESFSKGLLDATEKHLRQQGYQL